MTVVLFTQGNLPAFVPSPTTIGTLLHARTKIAGGTELGFFDSRTRPTADQVQILIVEATNEVMGKVQMPEDPESAYAGRVSSAIQLYTAMLIELGYFPEQVRGDRSAYQAFKDLYDLRIRALVSEGETGEPQGMGEGASGGGDSPADASWAFPQDPTGFLVGWTTRW